MRSLLGISFVLWGSGRAVCVLCCAVCAGGGSFALQWSQHGVYCASYEPGSVTDCHNMLCRAVRCCAVHCGLQVRLPMKQWMLRITAYADRCVLLVGHCSLHFVFCVLHCVRHFVLHCVVDWGQICCLSSLTCFISR